MGAPLRIGSAGEGVQTRVVDSAIVPAGAATAPARDRVQTASLTGLDYYVERLVKLIPSEVLALYLVGIGIIPSDQKTAIAIWAGVCLGLVVLVRAHATSDREKDMPPQWGAVLVSSVSFAIWLYTMPGPFQAYGVAVPWLGSLSVLLWTFLVPYFYRG